MILRAVARDLLVPRDDEVDNLGPGVRATSWALVSISLVFLLLRIYCKFMRHRGLWWDDHILILSWVLLAAETICTTYTTSKGFGMHIYDVPPENLEAIGMVGQIGGFLSILAVMWSKTSFAVTLLRITDGWTKRFVWFVIATVNVAMGISALFMFTQCTPVEKTWKPYLEGHCMAGNVIVVYGIFAAVYSGVMDITLALLPWKLVWGLQMKTKEKVGVGIAMTMGVFAGGTAIVKASKIPTIGEGDFTYHGSKLVVWSVAEAATTIMASSIPVLRALFNDLRSSARQYYGTPQTKGGGGAGGGGHKSRTLHSHSHHTHPNNTIITANRLRSGDGSAKADDDRSDKSILAGTGGRIVQTNEVTLEFTDRSTTDADSLGYEMGRMEKMDRGRVNEREDR